MKYFIKGLLVILTFPIWFIIVTLLLMGTCFIEIGGDNSALDKFFDKGNKLIHWWERL